MTEVEFDDLLEVVGTVMGPAPTNSYSSNLADVFEDPLHPANDNAQACWPYLPFPPGWSSSC